MDEEMFLETVLCEVCMDYGWIRTAAPLKGQSKNNEANVLQNGPKII